jgi:hypothetical protein
LYVLEYHLSLFYYPQLVVSALEAVVEAAVLVEAAEEEAVVLEEAVAVQAY